jgi:ABC-2 type transport system ATP-binding protein
MVGTVEPPVRRRLAAGLIGRPPVVLMDEPTTGLDPRSRQELWNVVDELRCEGTTVLLTMQYLDEADRLAQRIVAVDRGRVVADGTPQDLERALGGAVLGVRLARRADVGVAVPLLAGLAAGGQPTSTRPGPDQDRQVVTAHRAPGFSS